MGSSGKAVDMAWRFWRRRDPIESNAECPVCGAELAGGLIHGPGMMAFKRDPLERIYDCRRQHGTDHSRADLDAALLEERRRNPATYSQEMANLAERLRRGRD